MSLFRGTSSDTAEPDQEVKLSKDDVFHLLANHRRRATIRSLDENGPLSKRQVTEHVAVDEFGKGIEQITSGERKRVHVALHQVHLPKLEKHGVIEGIEGEFRLTGAADELLHHIYLDYSRLRKFLLSL